jgi:hypothetical protein
VVGESPVDGVVRRSDGKVGASVADEFLQRVFEAGVDGEGRDSAASAAAVASPLPSASARAPRTAFCVGLCLRVGGPGWARVTRTVGDLV